MSLFGFGKKENKVEKKESCCCGGNCDAETMEMAEQEKQKAGIKVLGGGCTKCHELLEHTKEALAELGISEDVELITDFEVIAAYGVMSTPALVVHNKVVSYGKVLKTGEIKTILGGARK